MSDNTIRVVLHRMGFSNKEMTTHGFRSLSSTRFNGMGFRPDEKFKEEVGEGQLAFRFRKI